MRWPWSTVKSGVLLKDSEEQYYGGSKETEELKPDIMQEMFVSKVKKLRFET